MMLTYCRNEEGCERLYLLPVGSLEAWIEPHGENGGWNLQCRLADADMTLNPEADKLEPTRGMLIQELATLIGIEPEQLSCVPFATFLGLVPDPRAEWSRRRPVGRARENRHGWQRVQRPR